MDLNGKSRHRIAAFISARSETETKPKEGPTLSQRISKKAAEPGPDSKGSRNKTGNAPRITLPASGREEEPRTYSWKDPTETGEFSSTWTDPEPFITTERHIQKYSDVFREYISNIEENEDLRHASCTASRASPVCLDTDKGTSLFELQPSYSSQPTLGEAYPNVLSSTCAATGNPGTELDAGSGDESTQEIDDKSRKTETVIAATERHSEGDTELGSLESSPEKAGGDSGDEDHQPGQDDFEGDFDIDDMNGEDSDGEELPSLQDIYDRCQAIRTKRFSGDLYNIWCVQMTANAPELSSYNSRISTIPAYLRSHIGYLL